MMLVDLESDGLNAWAGSSAAVTIGAVTESWAFDTEIVTPASNAIQVLDSLAGWASDAARGWAPVAWSWSWAAPVDGRLNIEIASSSPADVVFSGGASQLLGLAAASFSGVTTITGSLGVAASVACDFELRTWLPRTSGGSGISGAGSWLAVPQATAHVVPGVRSVLTEADAVALEAAQRLASQPRRAAIYQSQLDQWRGVAFGRVDVRATGPMFYELAIEVLG